MRLPKRIHWLFWDVDPARVDLRRDRDYVIGRIVEHGTLAEIRWLVRTYGFEAIHAFFRDVGDAELSARTIAFWRALFRAHDERWAEPPHWRKHNAAHWPA